MDQKLELRAISALFFVSLLKLTTKYQAALPEKSAKLLFHLSYDFSVSSALNIACKSFNAEATEIRRVRRED
jgi:hypothetical protein